ncbi:hypothetical protein HER10_EVM0006689 [Colletotrichum scovillei]|uniref:C3H1-type domain-containing protein n=1 Tax=Colletotrichum scovillei TaxID=1209932 RepID=A0A9P7RF81_9PEZI|nr:uncharacterized protein HER10_EVM0006689 [Colletotrichum scovillei]KAF4785472.1 hypothetical protein HER10_EVM0006689 [Colletotrichum scovillei]KAG7055588.1 hypothetical protein JMJ77_0008043 [Colletotrichum scovillei]KAG7075064.1 hypothetical protein JMJ76_0011527 [Colletotrichum scovillei]KAG7082102.1 hypothetical protein JMJ78_0004207 [Colletotrichum scovillei]
MEHNNNREDKKSKGKKPNRRPRDKRSTCRHFLEGRCTYGRENCNFPHRDGELRPEMVAAAAQQEEDVALAEARYNANAHALYSSVTYNSGLYVNGHYVNHGHYTNNGHINSSHSQHQHQPALPPPQWMGYRIPDPMPNALGRSTFDGTREEATLYFDSPLPPYAGPSRPPPGYGPPEYGAPGPYYAPPHHLVHGGHDYGYAGPSFPPPGLPIPLHGPPIDPMGMSWRPTHQPGPLSPPPGLGPGPSNALAPPPGFEPGPGVYPLSPSPAPLSPHQGSRLELAPVAATSPAPEEAPVPNTAPAAAVADSAQDPTTIQCWYGLGCKRPGCHFRHDGPDGGVANGEASGSGSGSGSANANGDGDEGYDGDGDDVSMSESSGSMYVPPPPASEQSYAAATPQSSPRQLPNSVAGDVTPPSVGGGVTPSSAAGDITPPSPEHTLEEYSAEEEGEDAEQPAAEEETPEAEHPEEESPQDEEGGQLSTAEETPGELLSEEHSSQEESVETPISSGEKKEEEEEQAPAAAQQPAARRPGPAVVDGRSAWGLSLVKANGTQEAA